MEKKHIYPYAKEVLETSDYKKMASLLQNEDHHWIAMSSYQKKKILVFVLIRIS